MASSKIGRIIRPSRPRTASRVLPKVQLAGSGNPAHARRGRRARRLQNVLHDDSVEAAGTTYRVGGGSIVPPPPISLQNRVDFGCFSRTSVKSASGGNCHRENALAPEVARHQSVHDRAEFAFNSPASTTPRDACHGVRRRSSSHRSRLWRDRVSATPAWAGGRRPSGSAFRAQLSPRPAAVALRARPFRTQLPPPLAAVGHRASRSASLTTQSTALRLPDCRDAKQALREAIERRRCTTRSGPIASASKVSAAGSGATAITSMYPNDLAIR